MNSDRHTISSEYKGGKAKALIELRRAGLNVPAFTVIPYSLWQQADADPDSSWPSLDSLCKQLELSQDAFAVNVLAAALRDQISGSPIPHALVEIIRQWVADNRNHPLTYVRSSAASEDSEFASSAGQYESVLVPTSQQEITKAVFVVLQSYYSSRVVAYRRSLGISNMGPKMGVILQRAISPTASGIMFGCDPVTGNPDLIVIESCFGLGTAIVAGALTPDRFIVDKHNLRILERYIGSKVLSDHIERDGSIKRLRTDEWRRSQLSLEDLQLLDLAQQYKRVESFFGPPQDVEWAFASDSLWILQSRPVTTFSIVEEPA